MFGSEFITPVISCGTLTINHVEGNVAPVTKTVTYNTVASLPGQQFLCWITSNLGADHQAFAVDDTTEASAGWYWQFNRMQGYKHTGISMTPNSIWVNPIDENSDWIAANDPCNLILSDGWRIPTHIEWSNAMIFGGWGDWSGPWQSALKLHAAGLDCQTDGYGQGGCDVQIFKTIASAITD